MCWVNNDKMFKLFIWKVFNLLHLTIMALSPSYKHTQPFSKTASDCKYKFDVAHYLWLGSSVKMVFLEELEFKTHFQNFCLQSCCSYHPPLHLRFLHYLPLVNFSLFLSLFFSLSLSLFRSLFLAFQSQRAKDNRCGILKRTQTDNEIYSCFQV